MKKIFLLLSIVSVFGLTACSNDDDVDHDTISENFERTFNFTRNNATGKYSVLFPLDPVIYDSDVVLVYRVAPDDEGFITKQLIPRTLYLPGEQEVDYDFNFTSKDILFTIDATFDLATTPQYTQNQTFRIVIVPGYFSKTVNLDNYDAVMSALEKEKEKKVIETVK